MKEVWDAQCRYTENLPSAHFAESCDKLRCP